MLVFFVIFAFLAEGFCEDAVIEKSTRPCLCGENEVYVKCRTICQPQFCNVSYTTYECDGVQKCEPGCDCIKKHLRDDYGRCVPIEKCPPPPIKCGENQVPSDCADNYSELPQITLCRPGCSCIQNHTRNSYDECVPTPPPLVCCENEEASTCKQTCPPQNCDWDPTKYACKPGPCQPGCNCKKGHLRDASGKCVPQKMCPPILPQCGDNEEPTDCAKNIRPFDSTLTIKCRPCQCVEGYARDINGVCVLKEEFCKNEPNTTFTLCPNQCKSTCKNPNGICSPDCREGYGCGCKPGYLLSEQGKCILPEDCPGGNPCGRNQTFVYCNAGCPTAECPKTNSRGIIACSQPNPCPSGCACKRNYKRQKDGLCILASECPPVKCAENERWNKCPPACFSENCGDKQTKITRCMTLIAHECQPQCVCKENCRRNSAGKCIPISECPPQCGENEELTDCSDSYPQPLATDVASESRIRCQPKCNCIAGYTRDSTGTCVIKQLQCGKNEEPNFCIAIFPSNCPPCRCIANHIRNGLGLCVPAPQCGENEELTDCSDSYPQPLATDVASESRIRCQPKCNCIAGYIRDSTGTCVIKQLQCGKNEEPNFCIAIFPSNCPPCRCIANHIRNGLGLCVPAPQCGKNEELTDCSDSYPQPLATDVASESRIRCQPKCKCIAGHIRDSTGACVRKQLQCGKNEEPNFCIAIFPSNCPPCRCIANYQRNSLGVCVAASPLPQCGKNEEPNDCSIIYPQPVRPISDIFIDELMIAEFIDVDQIRMRCQPCRCIKGYERNIKGVCVSKTVIQCGENEELSDCKQECPPQNCSWDPRLMDCRPVQCKAGCNCIKGYLRDVNGTCIPRENCPECNGDKNARYTECPNQCVSTCKNPNAICSQECGEPYGCKCKSGYILSEEGSCILPKECPGGNPCGRNESFVGCVIGCPTNNCPRDGSSAIAQCLPRNPCPSGCACKTNYKRVSFEDKTCISVTDCPPIKCGKNEDYNRCPSACFSEGCGSPQLEPKTCNTLVPNVCRPRCVCKTDFRRDSLGHCIPKEKCPPQCGENEELTDCGDTYPQRDTTNVSSESVRRCQPECTCIAGYMRDSNGVCVLTPQKCKGKNEVMNPCPSACFGDECGELDEDTAACNTFVEYVCKPRCMCRKGYCRDSNGNCILKEKCPAVS